MSNFYCEKCGSVIIDTPKGFVTECEHYPLEPEIKDFTALEKLELIGQLT